jgi:8-oxo-dGTP pyrophosphatase MutT (NUDIX family)
VTAGRQGAAILFVNRRGEVLLRLRGDTPGLAFPNQWDTIGGAVEPGEAHSETAVREAFEEIGLELTGHVYWRDFQSVVLLHIYAAPLHRRAEDLPLTEGAGLAWFDLDAALEMPLHAWVRAVLPNFVQSEVYRRLVFAAGCPADEGKP